MMDAINGTSQYMYVWWTLLTGHPYTRESNTVVRISYKVQLGPRYEGQLNTMAEPIPHEVRPLVRNHVYHPYHAADRQAETDSWV